MSTEGASSVDVTLHYSDGSMASLTTSVSDWFGEAPAGGFFQIDGRDRSSIFDYLFNDVSSPAIFGINVSADPAKTLIAMDVTQNTVGSERLIVFGASGF